MKIIRGLSDPQLNFPEGCVLTIGNFDGVHQGHQAIIQRVTLLASELKKPGALMIFDPYPEEVMRSFEKWPSRLTSLHEKVALLQRTALDCLIVVPFTSGLALLTAGAFVSNILFERLNAKHLVVGEDFHFGRNRMGDFEYLQSMTEQFGFDAESHQDVLLQPENRRISSSWVREALAQSDLKLAGRLLGREYSIQACFSELRKNTHRADFPDRKLPLKGIFPVEIKETKQRGIAEISANSLNLTLSRPLPNHFGKFVEILFV